MSTHTAPALICLRLGAEAAIVGLEAQFYALMSTVSINLEPRGWGTKYPMLMRRLYPGLLNAADVRAALEELADIDGKLAKLKPAHLVWDITDRVAQPDPAQVWLGAPCLGDVFRAPNGERMMDVLRMALITAMKANADVRVELKAAK